MFKRSLAVVSVLVAISLVAGSVFAASTTKALSTNFTLVNLSDQPADVLVDYLLTDGTAWPNVLAGNKSFTLAADGGMKQIRQYADTMDAGAGSAVVSSSQQLGAIVQIQARNQIATLGSYKGATEGKTSFYAPLLARRGSSLSGLANAQIIIQNAGTGPVDVDVNFLPNPKADGTAYTKTITGIPQGASFYYDLEEDATIKENWFGSGVISVASTTPTGKIVVVVNVFFGTNGLQTYNAFSSDQVDDEWIVPLFTSRLTNGLSTVVSIQNLSGGEIAAGELSLTCVNASGDNLFPAALTNAVAIANNGKYDFNPVSDVARFPANVQGACKVSTPGKNFVAFVQMRYVNVLPNESTAAYEAVPAGTASTEFFVPLVAKHLPNGFATVVNIANLANADNTVHIEYVPSPTECPVALCDKNSDGVVNALDTLSPADPTIGPYGGNQRNHRFNQESILPDGWSGSMKVTSVTGLPISGIVQLTYYTALPGDTYMGHGVFGQ